MMKKRRLININLALICLVIFISCGGEKKGPDRKEAMAMVIDSNYVLKDSVFTYVMDSSSIVFNFGSKPAFSDYSFHFWISKKSNDSDVVYHNAYSGKMGYVVNDQTIRIDSLDLKGESPDSLYVTLELEAYNTDLLAQEGNLVISSCVRYIEKSGDKKLVPYSDWYKEAVFINYNNLDKIKDKDTRKFVEQEVTKITKRAKWKEIAPEK